jgi:hypothetical protein
MAGASVFASCVPGNPRNPPKGRLAYGLTQSSNRPGESNLVAGRRIFDRDPKVVSPVIR